MPRFTKITASPDLMADVAAYWAAGITAGTLRKADPDGWRIVPADDQFWEDTWQLWLGHGAEFWDGAAWRPIDELREWKLGPDPASPPTTAS